MSSAEGERKLFCYLCGETDKQKMKCQVQITYEDFERISYILDTLRFMKLEMEFWDTFQGQFEKELMAEAECEHMDIEWEVKRYTQWLIDFCNTSPEPGARCLLEQLFELEKMSDKGGKRHSPE